MHIFYFLMPVIILFLDCAEQIKSPKKLASLCDEKLMPFIQKLEDGGYKRNSQAKKILKYALPVILNSDLPSERLLEKIAVAKPLSLKNLYSSLNRLYLSTDIGLAYLWKDVCIIRDLEYMSGDTYYIYFKKKKIYTLQLNIGQDIEFISSDEKVGWKIFDQTAQEQIELAIFDLPLDNSKINVRKFHLHSSKFYQKGSPNFHIEKDFGFLGSRAHSGGVMFDIEAGRQKKIS